MSLISKGRKYLFVAALLVLAVFGGYFSYMLRHVNDTLLQEKIIDRRFEIDIICDQIDRFVELDGNWDTYDYGQILSYVVARLDGTVGTYAELFDEDFCGMSERSPLYASAPFDPREYPELARAVRSNERGEMMIWFDKGDAAPQDLYIYYRWVPTDKELNNRYLAMVGVSEYSVDNTISGEVTGTAVALIAVAAVFIIGGALAVVWSDRRQVSV